MPARLRRRTKLCFQVPRAIVSCLFEQSEEVGYRVDGREEARSGSTEEKAKSLAFQRVSVS